MQKYYLVQKSKEDSNMITQETNHFKVKTCGGFNLVVLKVNKSTMIEWKIIINLNPKSKATSCKTY